MNRSSLITWLAALAGMALMWSCSSVKHVPEGAYLVDHVKINIEDKHPDLSSAELVNYLRQTPNHKVLGFAKLQLATYNLSGRDSTKWWNRWLRGMGQPPVIYQQNLTDASVSQLRQALINRGYLDASVSCDTVMRPRKKKIDVTYNIVAGTPMRIASIDYEIPDTAVRRIVMSDSARFTLRRGDLLDRDELDAERTAIADRLRNRGYYNFSKEYITFTADTVTGSKDVDLTMIVNPPAGRAEAALKQLPVHEVYYIRNVTFLTDYHLGYTLDQTIAAATDTVMNRGYTFLYGPDRWLTPGTLEEKCFIEPGRRYSARSVDRTYEYLSGLGIVKSINIEMRPAGTIDGHPMLDAYIMLTRNKKQGLTFDVEGTNSEGDFGFGVGLTYQHRNLAHRSRLLTAKFRASYESLSGNLDGLINNNYQEYAGEVGFTFPKFAFPFLSGGLRKRVKAVTEVALSFNYQERPEYTRIIFGAAWKYKWGDANNLTRRTLDLLSINYVRLPKSTLDFLDQIAPSNPLLRYSYEDHFIMDIAYSYYHTNRRLPGMTSRRSSPFQPVVYTLRASVETAGNLLRAFSAISGQKRSDGVYKIFDIQYSQYAKAEFEYSVIRNFTQRHGLAFRVGAGVGVPYGNSSALPFEKRFYAGGANGVRGWSVRTLGPGCFDGRNSVTDFINQCGDISLILSAEYRAKLFWILEGALFVDGGNIWTIRDYENQPGGVFRFGEFYKQIAASYGIGLRLDFTYFLLRFDLGLKAVNPARNQERWPIIHPDWHRDATFHFAVGYPF
ncbi:MAG: BamA/TamA family outer membrane protein [Bacteroides sp.]|nr:BamA/TamA family outer membrane protein [Bacteroides sp.]